MIWDIYLVLILGRQIKIADMPTYARHTILKMVDGGLIDGAGSKKEENNRSTDLDLSLDLIRVFIANDWAGLYGKKL